MVRLLVVAAIGFIFIPQLASDARVSKVTCEKYVGYEITYPQNIAIWLSGYYNGKRGKPIVDTQGFDAHTKKVQDFCFRNPATPVMQATETLFEVKGE
jgi:acid stress chaperone HdeB